MREILVCHVESQCKNVFCAFAMSNYLPGEWGELLFGAANVAWFSEPPVPEGEQCTHARCRAVTAGATSTAPEQVSSSRRSKEGPACLHMVSDKVSQLLICFKDMDVYIYLYVYVCVLICKNADSYLVICAIYQWFV